MEKSRKGLFLQFFMSISFTCAGTGTTIFTVILLSGRANPSWQALGLGILAIFASEGLSLFLGAKLFRWYNTESAIRQCLEEGVTFKGALMEDCRWRHAPIISMVGGICCIASSISGIQHPFMVRAISIILLTIDIISIVTMAIVIGKSLSMYSQRRHQNDQRIPVWHREREVEGMKIKTPLMLPISEVPGFYW